MDPNLKNYVSDSDELNKLLVKLFGLTRNGFTTTKSRELRDAFNRGIELGYTGWRPFLEEDEGKQK